MTRAGFLLTFAARQQPPHFTFSPSREKYIHASWWFLTVARAGFERMVAEVCLGKVGAVAAREVSRFARNSREWQQLVEVCRIVDTLLIDQETVYSPRQGNDRLLLGLKGTLNEYELDLLRQRASEARVEK